MGSGRNAARPVLTLELDVVVPVGLIDPAILGPKSGNAAGRVGDRVGDRGGLLPGTDLANLELAEPDEENLEFAPEVDEEKIEVAVEEVDCANSELVAVPVVLADAVEVVRFGERWGAADVETGREGDEGGGAKAKLDDEAAREGGDTLGWDCEGPAGGAAAEAAA
jgi:hypothetical protein